MRIEFTVATAISMALTGCVSTILDAQHQTRVQTAMSLTKEHFKNTATIEDDSLDVTATITTAKGFQETRGLLSIVSNDNCLRAVIDKKTGHTTIELYQVLYYPGNGWNFFQTVNYETPNGPELRPVTQIKQDVNCSGAGSPYAIDDGCKYVEHVSFDVDESFLRTIAAGYQPGQQPGPGVSWNFKFTAKSGVSVSDFMLTAEVAGFLEAIDSYRASKSLTK